MRLLPLAKQMLSLESAIRATVRTTGHRIRLAANMSFATRSLSAIAAARAAHPDAEIEFVIKPFRQRITAVADGDCDLALIRGSVEQPGLTVEKLWVEDLVIATTRGHPLATSESVTLAELSPYPLLLPPNRNRCCCTRSSGRPSPTCPPARPSAHPSRPTTPRRWNSSTAPTPGPSSTPTAPPRASSSSPRRTPPTHPGLRHRPHRRPPLPHPHHPARQPPPQPLITSAPCSRTGPIFIESGSPSARIGLPIDETRVHGYGAGQPPGSAFEDQIAGDDDRLSTPVCADSPFVFLARQWHMYFPRRPST